MQTISPEVLDVSRRLDSLNLSPTTNGNGSPPPENAFDGLSVGQRHQYAREVNHYFRTGQKTGLLERFTLTTGTSSGAMLPRQVVAPIAPRNLNAYRRAIEFYGLTPLNTARPTAVNVPVFDATAGGEVAQDAIVADENLPVADQSIVMPPRTFESGIIWVSNTLLAASAGVDFLETLEPQLNQIKEYALEKSITSAVVADSLITQAVTTASPNGLTFGELLNLSEALPDKYDEEKAIVLSRAAYRAAEGLVDGQGYPLLTRAADRSGLEINGTPIFKAQGFETLAAGHTVGAVFSLFGFSLRDVAYRNLSIINAWPTRPDQTGYNLFAYHSFGWAPSAVAKLKTAAS